MKFSKYLMMAGAAAMLTACSSEEPIVGPDNSMAMPEGIENCDAFAMIALGMPEGAATRVAQPETSLIESEYKVANGQMLIFKYAADGEEANATYVGKFPFTSNWVEFSGTAIDISRETTFTMAFPKGTFEDGETYGACVVLNAPSTFPYPTAAVVGEDGSVTTPAQTFKAWSETDSSVEYLYKANNTTYMTMVSAPEYKSGKASTLVKIDPNKIKKNVNEVSAADAMGGFYVQRSAAKISVTKQAEYALTGAYAGAKVTIDAWKADVTATKSRPVQVVDGVNFALGTHMYSNATNFPTFTRCNWGIGSAYDGTYNASNYTISTTAPTKFEDYQYVKENTMAAQQQIEKRTTRVVLKATYKKDGTNGTTVLKVGSVAGLFTKDDFVADLKAKAEANQVANAKVDMKQTTFANGYYSLAQFCTISDGEGSEASDDVMDEIAKQMGLSDRNAKEIAIYANGVCYYTVLVRHFYDEDAPLEGDLTNGLTDASKYLDSHTGRYGVLRNNWYDVAVSAVNKIGEPVIPTPGDGPDDKEKEEVQALGFNIRMLNWAKRSHNVTL